MYQQLAQLIRDAVWLKSYLAAVMRLETEAFQNAYAALGPAKGSLPVPLPEDMTGVQGVTDHVHSGMIAASRPYPGPPTVSSSSTALHVANSACFLLWTVQWRIGLSQLSGGCILMGTT